MSSVAIVILNFNGLHYLKKFLPTVIQHSEGCDVVVADNASDDGSVDFLDKHFPSVKLIRLDQNYGFCGGYNRALAQLDSDIFVLLNSDIEVTPNWIKPVVDLFEQQQDVAAIQPKLMDFKAREKFEYAGGAGGFIDRFGYPFCRGRIFDTIEQDTGQYDDHKELFWASGACLFIRGELFKSFGGFDEEFFAHMEEIDLCWRLKRSGHRVLFCPDSVLYHVGGGTLTYSNPRKTYLNFRNSLLVLLKNLPTEQVLPKLVFRWVMDYVAAMKFLFSGQVKDVGMIIKAHWYVLTHFRKNWQKRVSIAPSNATISGIYPHFLLYHYHVKRKQKFSELTF